MSANPFFFARPPVATSNRPVASAHFNIRPITGALGAEITGIDVATAGAPAIADLRAALIRHQVVVIRGQALDPAALEQVTLRLGSFGHDPYIRPMPGFSNVLRLLKEADERHPDVFAEAWHSDWSFLDTPPAFTLLYGHDVPDWGGDTMFASQIRAFEALSPAMVRLLEPLKGIHSARRAYAPAARSLMADRLPNMDIVVSESAMATRLHPIIRTHPESGARALYVSPSYTIGIDGFIDQEAQALLGYLFQISVDPRFTCRVRWEQGSLTIWDNRSVMHLPIGDYHGARREMYRTTVAGTEPMLEPCPD
ncbi:TauD/TfdA dioxygenase family protein [Tistrella sp.]|uniref:Taurine dioxygenase n=1 Tax=Tistrella mobilis TaxID=171437 RepID=A0A3B9IR95_9PROT|nr:TauD/TfdA family dioxygenase [Tistrella sp.]MAD40621.1 taurine dioxygenase [Tistrella sp.]HAE49857.1 taurine dioxygenase [Tistrella mobilis]|tara:strand:- start:1891 stop:2820 length:930 start_codon:yes stop_codon:yes gene_type:complete